MEVIHLSLGAHQQQAILLLQATLLLQAILLQQATLLLQATPLLQAILLQRATPLQQATHNHLGIHQSLEDSHLPLPIQLGPTQPPLLVVILPQEVSDSHWTFKACC